MPGSRIQGKEEIKEWLNKHPEIKIIVDIGAGSATYPKYLGEDNYIYKAVEVWEPYVEMWNLNKYYREIVIGDAYEVEWPEGDCVIFGDVLEHMTKEKAMEVLLRGLETFSHVVVSIPISKDGEITRGKMHYGNKHEVHASAWDYSELKRLTNWEETYCIGSDPIGIFMK